MDNKKYLNFDSQLQTMHDYIQPQAVSKRLGISEADKTTLDNKKAAFQDILSQYTDPAKRTQVITKQINKDYTEIHKWVASLRQIIKINNQDKLSEQDYASLYIHENKTPSKHTKPDTSPTLELNHIEHLEARISAHHSSEFDQGTKPSLPAGIDTIDWQWVINDDRQAPANLIYSEHKTSTTATLKLEFTPIQTGQFCHLVARYGVTSGAVGAFSVNLSFAIT